VKKYEGKRQYERLGLDMKIISNGSFKTCFKEVFALLWLRKVGMMCLCKFFIGISGCVERGKFL